MFVLKKLILTQLCSLPPPRILEGPLAPNTILSKAKVLLHENVLGPESFAVHSSFKTIYTGLKSGHIVELRAKGPDSITAVYLFKLISNNCSGSYSDALQCGRPLGLRFRKNKADYLLIADAYHGLYEFNVVTGYDPNATPIKYLNDVDELDDGITLILSEPSKKFSDRDCLYSLVEHGGDGRLLSYNIKTGEVKVLLDGLQYPNGIQVERSGKCVLFAEMGNIRILRYFLKPLSVICHLVIDNLPGYPDNIRFSKDGNLWVPLGSLRLQSDEFITRNQMLRNSLAKVCLLNGSFFFIVYNNCTHLSSISQVSEVHCKFLKVLAYVESISPQVLRATGG
ncbi:unnamed protein product [Enterobius vermicularis]|uniref:Str_synth domain-containing protein n=1 Tax=Enterobius vermicularis TaxID=51028 RepID=A0A0N4V2E4_ENTVE|nr:unnamed protein product [Enterobius vermicularis]